MSMSSTDEAGSLRRKRQRLTDMLIRAEGELLTAEVEQQVLARLDGHSNTNTDTRVTELRAKVAVCKEMIDGSPASTRPAGSVGRDPNEYGG